VQNKGFLIMATQKPIKPFTLADINEYERGQGAQTRLADIRAISPDVIAALIANGPLDTFDDFVYATIADYASHVGGRDAADKIEPVLKGHVDAMDALGELELGCAEAGYVLGLAVGLALGSGQPFAGAVKKGGAR